eukprot:TRINITY_DN20592_c0_g1_i1.p1 TRINITY_DN20592_c0_g1~~TRINITY_DN20592_c0_g1_i1.p1  ORF type:complete len:316 (+),score=59.46 TRINITY_DN20592_c0_g1_i1:32-979(+)
MSQEVATGTTLVVGGVVSTEEFWKISSLLSESSVACAGVDVVFTRDECKNGDDFGCLMIVTQRRVGTLTWCREEDNLLRMLKDLKERNERPLTEEEQQQYNELSPRFDDFVQQGMKAISDTSFNTYIAWLPYTLLMSINPGLLTKKGRKSVETNSTLPLGNFTNNHSDGTEELPAVWKSAMLVPVSSLIGIKKGKNRLINRDIHFTYRLMEDVKTCSVLTSDLQIDAVNCIVSGEGAEIGSLVVSLEGQVPSKTLLEQLKKEATQVTLQTVPARRTTLVLGTATIFSFFKSLDDLSIKLKKSSADASILECSQSA